MTYKVNPSAELPLREAYPFARAHGLIAEATAIRETDPPQGVHESVFRRALIADLFRRHRLLEKFVQACWPLGAGAEGTARLARYREILARQSEGTVRSSRAAEDGSVAIAHQLAGSGSRRLVAFVRGLSIYKIRRILRQRQKQLLTHYLPSSVVLVDVFDKSGNYALVSSAALDEVGRAVRDALRHEDRLRDLPQSHITVLTEAEVRPALDTLLQGVAAIPDVRISNPRKFEARIGPGVWRAGLTFLPDSTSVTPFAWPPPPAVPTVHVLASLGRILQFLKREEVDDERRITFGVPTQAVDAALSSHLGWTVTTTSRSGSSVRGILRTFR